MSRKFRATNASYINVALGKTSPLHLAAQGGRHKIIQSLLKYGANPTALNDEYKTPRELVNPTENTIIATLENAEKERQKQHTSGQEIKIGSLIQEFDE